MSVPCGQRNADGTTCRRPVARRGAPCGATHLTAGPAAQAGNAAAAAGPGPDPFTGPGMEPADPPPRPPRGRGGPPLITDRDWLAAATASGLTQGQIAAEAGCSTRTVIRAMQRLGVACQTPDHGPQTPQLGDADWLRDQYQARRRSAADIAAELGVSNRTVTAWLRRHGIEVRPPGWGGSVTGEAQDRLSDADWLRYQYQTRFRSFADIAAELGVDRRTVADRLRLHGIEVRPPPGGGPVTGEAKDRLGDADWLRDQYQTRSRSAADIAAELDVSPPTVGVWLRRHGIEVRPPGWGGSVTGEAKDRLSDADWLRDQYQTRSRSTADIAAEIDVSPSTVGVWLRRHGIEVRQRGIRP